MTKRYTAECSDCDFSKDTNSLKKLNRIINDHLEDNPTHELFEKMNGFAYIVLCRDCGYHRLEPTKDLADDTRKRHRMTHYGHDVDIRRKGWDNKNDDDAITYKRKQQIDPDAFNSKFAKRVIFHNFGDDNIKSVFEKALERSE